MAKKAEKSKEQAELDALYSLVYKHMRMGRSKEDISKQLIEEGADKERAQSAVSKIYDEIVTLAEKEKFTPQALVPALAGGGLAALAGGVLWGLVAYAIKHEVGYMAIGIGFLAGYAVYLFSGKRKGIPLQIVAALSSLIGILIGKYVIFFAFVRQAIAKEYGAASAAKVSMVSPVAILTFFKDGLKGLVSGYDILWVVLAVYFAWRILQGVELDLQPKSRLVDEGK